VPAAVHHRRRLVAVLGLAAVVALIVGVALGRGSGNGPLGWVGTPRTGMAGAEHVLYGTVVNHAKTPVRVRSAQVTVRDSGGKTLASTAVFSGGYVPLGAPATTVVLRPGGRLPLGVSWTGTGARVEVAGSKLTIPD
jgi:hypothetical protein